MNDYKLEITQVDNGFVLEGNTGETDSNSKVVIEIPNTEFGELEGMEQLLRIVMDYFGVYYNKNNAKNIVIDVVENNEYDTEDLFGKN